MKNLVLLVLIFCSSFLYSDNLEFVNPFIGTGGNGHLNPGAVTPFGMVKVGPDTGTEGWDYCGGYRYEDKKIIGFSHTHLNGTGIGDYLDIMVMPGSGGNFPKDHFSSEGAQFSHSNEEASPGYYRVRLDNGIGVELTATCRTALHRYSFNDNDIQKLIIDTGYGYSQDQNIRSSFRIIDNRRVEGVRVSRGWSEGHHVFFVAEFSKDITASELSGDIEGSDEEQGAYGKNIRALLQFNGESDKLVMRVAISTVSCSNAWDNLRSEQNTSDFDGIRGKAEDLWRTVLNRIDVETSVNADKKKFYTALYNLYTHPSTLSDVDGRYRGYGDNIYKVTGRARYTVFSLWDTFRAVHPLFTILEPERNAEFIDSLLDYSDHSGRLPVWELAGKDTGTMIGYHGVSLIADSIAKGGRVDVKRAYLASVNSMLQEQKAYRNYILKGYFPWNKVNESVSKTLEHSYDDWCISIIAEKAGFDKDAETLKYMSRFYKNLFDSKTGFMRGRDEKGRWKTPFDPLYSNHRFDEYTEGNAWQYLWFVPHDMDGLIALLGGNDAFCNKLDGLFNNLKEVSGSYSSQDISGMIGQYAHGNEPDHHVPYLYVHGGRAWRTQELVRQIMDELYSAEPDGLCGNEDCGQLSAWYIFSAMGFYPVCPGKPEYTIGVPLFERMSIKLKEGKVFRIIVENPDKDKKYIDQVLLNGEPLENLFIKHSDIMAGGELIFRMKESPGS